MIRILILGLKVLGIFLISCQDERKISLVRVEHTSIKNFRPEFITYNLLDTLVNSDEKAVICSFIGDYQRSVKLAEGENAKLETAQEVALSKNDLDLLRSQLEKKLRNSAREEAIITQKLLDALSRPHDLKELFENASVRDARALIVNEAAIHDFVLINEAHYCTQHRAFTYDLLPLLWKQGFRYLALETLSYNDKDLMERGYPVDNTGFYTRDSMFGNLIREAIKMGFTLIPYEIADENFVGVRDFQSASFRDSIQAWNIYRQTKGVDRDAKVIVHAGYSHISETGDSNYRPMGAALRRIANQDILSIDQVMMTEKDDASMEHMYYRYVVGNFNIHQPSVVVTHDGKILIDRINHFGIDIQVYHPRTVYLKGRPAWLIKEDFEAYDLPPDLKKFRGHWFRLSHATENEFAIPVDQFVIGESSAIIARQGNYSFHIIDNEATLKVKGDLTLH